MSDSLLSTLLIFAELGAALLLYVLVMTFFLMRRNRKDSVVSETFIAKVKKSLPTRQDRLVELFKNSLALDANKAEQNAESLVREEKHLYSHLIRIFVAKERELLNLITDDMDNLTDHYLRLLTESGDDKKEKESREVLLKRENKALREENKELKSKLEASMASIESIMSEYASMYEGGQKEGEQRLKNEMYQLKQTLKEKVGNDNQDDEEEQKSQEE